MMFTQAQCDTMARLMTHSDIKWDLLDSGYVVIRCRPHDKTQTFKTIVKTNGCLFGTMMTGKEW
jgi:hypothetical protein